MEKITNLFIRLMETGGMSVVCISHHSSSLLIPVCLFNYSNIEKCLFEDNWTREERAEYVAVSLQRKYNTSAPFHVIGETHSHIYADLQLLDKMISFAILHIFLFLANKHICTCALL